MARSGVTHLRPDLKGQLPDSGRALETWRILEGHHEKEPLCPGAAGLMIEELGKVEKLMGYAAWSQIDELLREQDVEHLLGADIIPDQQGAVSLMLGIIERGETTKSGTNQGVVVQHPDLCAFYIRRKEEIGPTDRVFPFHIDRYRRWYAKAAKKFGLLEEGPHVFRHTGATYLIHYKKWERQKARDFGRWAKDKSMSNYGHSHLLGRNQQRLSKADNDRGAWMWEDVEERCGLRTRVLDEAQEETEKALERTSLFAEATTQPETGTQNIGAYPELAPAPPPWAEPQIFASELA
jgi:hypothetical protein